MVGTNPCRLVGPNRRQLVGTNLLRTRLCSSVTENTALLLRAENTALQTGTENTALLLGAEKAALQTGTENMALLLGAPAQHKLFPSHAGGY